MCCDCFLCKNEDKPEQCVAYLKGYIKACDDFIHWAKKNKIKPGSISQDDLGGFYACTLLDKEESECLLGEYLNKTLITNAPPEEDTEQ